LLVPFSSARATDEPPGYRETIQEALSEFNSEHFQEALALFAHAHALYPNARTLRSLGMTQFELRNYGECIARLEAALASQEKPLDGSLRRETEELLARSRRFVGHLDLSVVPRSAQLRVDGRLLETTADHPIMLAAGEHTIEAQARGYAPQKQTVNVTGGELQQLRFELRNTPASSTLHADSETTSGRSSEVRRWYHNPWLWSLLGVAVVGAAVGTGIALGGHGGKARSEPAYQGNLGSLTGP
jgi:tetratricopeptide (TPR) repeat protein